MSSPLISSLRPSDSRVRLAAFTLIELLTVIAIIGILAAITFGVSKGVTERAAISTAKGELAALAAALENYKRQYGDYPQTGGTAPAVVNPTAVITTASAQSLFFNALAGKFGPKLAPLQNSKTFVEFAKFNLETANFPVQTNTTDVANAFLDPWGRRYVYRYRDTASPATWTAPSYVLFSVGPDGLTKNVTSDPSPAGVVDYADVNNADNIYANR
jgi:prepilin-type N-terminal cleavage/methylation domain-containing protein